MPNDPRLAEAWIIQVGEGEWCYHMRTDGGFARSGTAESLGSAKMRISDAFREAAMADAIARHLAEEASHAE